MMQNQLLCLGHRHRATASSSDLKIGREDCHARQRRAAKGKDPEIPDTLARVLHERQARKVSHRVAATGRELADGGSKDQFKRTPLQSYQEGNCPRPSERGRPS